MKKLSKLMIALSLVMCMSTQAQANAFGEGIIAGVIGSAVLGGILAPRPMIGYPAYPSYPAAYPAYPVYPQYYTHRPMMIDRDIYIPECGCVRTMRVPAY